MREILFRGKAGPTWVIGSLLAWPDGQMEICTQTTDEETQMDKLTVNPETVGQFTGLTDKNGKKVFEGDIVKDESGVVYPVVFELTGFYLKYAPPHSHGFHFDLLPLSNYWHAHGAIIEVIGNIHDNPELLEVPT